MNFGKMASTCDAVEASLRASRGGFVTIRPQVCRSLFEAHKLLFSFLMTIKIMMGDDRVDALAWRFCISGQTIKPLSLENPAPDWIEARDAASSVILNLPGSS